MINLLKFFHGKIENLKQNPISEEELQDLTGIITDDIADRVANNDLAHLVNTLTIASGPRLDENGKCRILNGNMEGWKLIEQDVYYYGYVFSKALHQGIHLNSRCIGGILSMCLNWKYDEFAHACLEYAAKVFQQEKSKFEHWQQIHVFVSALAYKYYHNRFPEYLDILPPAHLYRRVIQAWDDQAAFQELLPEVCDAHILAVYDDGKDKMTEILCCDFIPFDLQMIKNLRQKDGHSMPPIDHPLMKSLLAAIPTEPPGYDPSTDQLLQLVLRHEDVSFRQ